MSPQRHLKSPISNLKSPFSPWREMRRHWAVFLGLVVALAVWCGVDVARRAIVDRERPALHMTDVTVYTEAGAAFFDGREPYDVANIRGWKYLYPPLFALLIAPLSALSPPWQAAAWFAVSAVMALGCYFECRRMLALFAREIPRWLLVTALAAVLFPTFNCLQRGQMGVALLYFLLLGFRLVMIADSKWGQAWGGVLLALPIAFKLTPALPAACLAGCLGIQAWCDWRPRNAVPRAHNEELSSPAQFGWSTAGLLAGLVTFFLLIPGALLGWRTNWQHLETWYSRVASRVNDVRSDDFGENVASYRNQSLHNAAFRCGNWITHAWFGGPDDVRMDVTRGSMPMDDDFVQRGLGLVRSAALVLLLALMVLAGVRRDRLLTGAVFGLACVATLVVSPVARGHYFVFWIPAVVFAPLWLFHAGYRRAAVFCAALPVVLTIAHYAAIEIAGRAGLLGLGTTAWYFVSGGQLLWIARQSVAAKAEGRPAQTRDEAPAESPRPRAAA